MIHKRAYAQYSLKTQLMDMLLAEQRMVGEEAFLQPQMPELHGNQITIIQNKPDYFQFLLIAQDKDGLLVIVV